jgi:hypothetical protein
MPMLRVAWDAKVNKLKESLSREVEDIAYWKSQFLNLVAASWF